MGQRVRRNAEVSVYSSIIDNNTVCSVNNKHVINITGSYFYSACCRPKDCVLYSTCTWVLSKPVIVCRYIRTKRSRTVWGYIKHACAIDAKCILARCSSIKSNCITSSRIISKIKILSGRTTAIVHLDAARVFTSVANINKRRVVLNSKPTKSTGRRSCSTNGCAIDITAVYVGGIKI